MQVVLGTLYLMLHNGPVWLQCGPGGVNTASEATRMHRTAPTRRLKFLCGSQSAIWVFSRFPASQPSGLWKTTLGFWPPPSGSLMHYRSGRRRKWQVSRGVQYGEGASRRLQLFTPLLIFCPWREKERTGNAWHILSISVGLKWNSGSQIRPLKEEDVLLCLHPPLKARDLQSRRLF